MSVNYFHDIMDQLIDGKQIEIYDAKELVSYVLWLESYMFWKMDPDSYKASNPKYSEASLIMADKINNLTKE